LEKHKISCDEGSNLLDAINEVGLDDISIFGVCNKQLACHSCAVHIVKNYDKLEKPNENEEDVHCELGDIYRPNCTRMSCQIFLNEKMKDMEVEIPRSAFFFLQDEEKNNNIK
jgi:ferredoxin